MIDTIIFDLGGVLLNIDYNNLYKYLASTTMEGKYELNVGTIIESINREDRVKMDYTDRDKLSHHLQQQFDAILAALPAPQKAKEVRAGVPPKEYCDRIVSRFVAALSAVLKTKLSASAPPLSTSLPSPPASVSAPIPPSSVLLAAFPVSMSSPGVPLNASCRSVR